MKNCILLVFALISVYSFGQDPSAALDQKTALEKVSALNPSELRIDINNEFLVPNPLLADARTAEDSAALVGKEIKINNKYVRMDPKKVEKLFPETISFDAEENATIDYISFIPILLEALNEQQKIIEEMKSRILILEKNSER